MLVTKPVCHVALVVTVAGTCCSFCQIKLLLLLLLLLQSLRCKSLVAVSRLLLFQPHGALNPVPWLHNTGNGSTNKLQLCLHSMAVCYLTEGSIHAFTHWWQLRDMAG
jgi:hypothetical protein